MGKFSVPYARRQLLILALAGAGVVFFLLIIQTLAGDKLGSDVGRIWMRYLVLWLPLLLTLVGLMWYPAAGHRAYRSLFLICRILIVAYGLAHLAVFLVQPVLPQSLLQVLRRAGNFLLPMEAITVVLVLLLVLKPASSAAETLSDLSPEERDSILEAFRPVARKARQKIGENEVRTAIEDLLQFCEENDLPLDEFLKLKRRWNDNRREVNNNLISNEEANREEARITEALLSAIKQMEAGV